MTFFFTLTQRLILFLHVTWWLTLWPFFTCWLDDWHFFLHIDLMIDLSLYMLTKQLTSLWWLIFLFARDSMIDFSLYTLILINHYLHTMIFWCWLDYWPFTHWFDYWLFSLHVDLTIDLSLYIDLTINLFTHDLMIDLSLYTLHMTQWLTFLFTHWLDLHAMTF